MLTNFKVLQQFEHLNKSFDEVSDILLLVTVL